MPLKVTIALNKGKIVELNLPNKQSTLLDLKHSFSKNVQKLSIYRQSFKLEVCFVCVCVCMCVYVCVSMGKRWDVICIRGHSEGLSKTA